jgi:hypothetical protein
MAFASAALIVAACRGPQASASAAPDYSPTATIKDLMEAIVDPSADVVWDAVTTTVDASGIDEQAPRTDEEWATVRRGAIRLVESTNLLMMPGRHVAQAGERSVTPGIELEPEEMEALINKDWSAWTGHVRALHDVSMEVLATIDKKDAPALADIGGRLDEVCEGCHRQYWYPNEVVPDFPSDTP